MGITHVGNTYMGNANMGVKDNGLGNNFFWVKYGYGHILSISSQCSSLGMRALTFHMRVPALQFYHFIGQEMRYDTRGGTAERPVPSPNWFCHFVNFFVFLFPSKNIIYVIKKDCILRDGYMTNILLDDLI